VILGAAAGRASPEQSPLFQSVGGAVEDGVAADLVYRAAVLEDR
jgi:ornithine cyclodeaminase/alanine dehydrogenase-like protein (mu-crystallin family)